VIKTVLENMDGKQNLVDVSTKLLTAEQCWRFCPSSFSVTSWQFGGDTDTSWVATKSPKGPLRSADGRSKEAPCHTTTQPHCAFVCLQSVLVDLNIFVILMGGTNSADAIREARRASRDRRLKETHSIAQQRRAP